MTETELRVIEVSENSHASSLGIEVDDVLRFINDVKLSSMEQLLTTLESNLGKIVQYVIRRGEYEFVVKGKALKLGIKIKCQPVLAGPEEFEEYDNQNSTSDSITPLVHTTVDMSSYGFSSLVLFAIATLGLAGGLFFADKFITFSLGYNISMAVGVALCCIFFSLGQGLHYLKQLAAKR